MCIRDRVYVVGLLLRPGETLVSFLDAHSHLGIEDLVLKNMQVSADGMRATFPPDAAVEVFYNACSAHDAAAAAARLRAQRTQVYRDPLMLTACLLYTSSDPQSGLPSVHP